jgi:hypothetical protein
VSVAWIIHVAGPPVGAAQTCVACGYILMDNTPWIEGRVAVMEGDDSGPGWWPAGERIGTNDLGSPRAVPNVPVGGCTFVVGPPGRPLEADERLCAGVN